MIPPKTDLDVKRRADFRGKIINLTLDLSILSWISPTKSSRFGTRTWKKDASKATDLGVLEWRLRAVAVCIEWRRGGREWDGGWKPRDITMRQREGERGSTRKMKSNCLCVMMAWKCDWTGPRHQKYCSHTLDMFTLILRLQAKKKGQSRQKNTYW